jgi:phage anti-repressor protein
MKNIKHLLTILILLISISGYGQIERDSTIINYIEVQSEFVGLNDLNRIPDYIRPYLSSIKEYMNKNKMPLNEYWIWTSYVQEDSNSLSIPICHYEGFVVKKKFDKKIKMQIRTEKKVSQ